MAASKPKLISEEEFRIRKEKIRDFLGDLENWRFTYELHKLSLCIESISSKVLLEISEYLEADFKIFPDTNPQRVCVVFTKKE